MYILQLGPTVNTVMFLHTLPMQFLSLGLYCDYCLVHDDITYLVLCSGPHCAYFHFPADTSYAVF
jgi:hypothetical protein